MTLAEVLVALVIMSIAITALMTAYESVSRTSVSSSDETKALYFAEKKIEEAKIRIQNEESVSYPLTAAESVYSYTVEVYDAEDSTSLYAGTAYNLNEIRVTVIYPSAGNDRKVELVTRVARRN